jgi:hypothetical protein
VVTEVDRSRQLADGGHALPWQPLAGIQALFQQVMKAAGVHGRSETVRKKAQQLTEMLVDCSFANGQHTCHYPLVGTFGCQQRQHF